MLETYIPYMEILLYETRSCPVVQAVLKYVIHLSPCLLGIEITGICHHIDERGVFDIKIRQAKTFPTKGQEACRTT